MATTTQPKYPHVKVNLGNLRGPEGNAFCVLGRVQAAMREAGLPEQEIDAFQKEATAGTYEALLRTCYAWVKCRAKA